jgi:hypothetical protein
MNSLGVVKVLGVRVQKNRGVRKVSKPRSEDVNMG